MSPAMAPLVDWLRRATREDPTVGTNETVLTPGAADVGIISRRPAIVSVKPIVPSKRIDRADPWLGIPACGGRYVLFAETMDVSLRQRRSTDLRAAMRLNMGFAAPIWHRLVGS